MEEISRTMTAINQDDNCRIIAGMASKSLFIFVLTKLVLHSTHAVHELAAAFVHLYVKLGLDTRTERIERIRIVSIVLSLRITS